MDRAARRRAARGNGQKIAGVWFSNAPFVQTGYGTQTHQAVRRMIGDGHKMVVACNYGLEATQTNYEGIELWPKGFDPYGMDIVAPYFRDWSRQHPNDVPYVFTLYDTWTFTGDRWDTIPVVPWVPIDHMPIPPAVEAFCRKPNVTPIAMSAFGAEQLRRKGIDCEYVPHAIEGSVFKPTPRVQQDDGKWLTSREIMGVPEDAFVVMIANANKSTGLVHRKAFPEQLLAFSIFAKDHPDAILYVHSERHGSMGGLAFDPLIAACGIAPDRVRFVNQYQLRIGIPQEILACIYSGADVLLSPTYGEGFGITVLDAQFCGLPVIVSDFTAQDELAGPDAIKVGGQPWWDAAQLAWWQIPSVPDMVDALREAYARGRFRSEAAMAWARENYDADKVYSEQWRPVLERLAEKAGASTAVVPLTFCNDKQTAPILTIYIPTYRRPELAALLDSLAPQLVPEVEVIVSDNDGSAARLVRERLKNAPCRVDYSRRESNIGGDANIMRGFSQGSGEWVWIVGDDDVLAPDAISSLLTALADLHYGSRDRLILLSKSAPKKAAGASGTLADIARKDPALPLAATLITANVCRREAVDLAAGLAKVDTKYGHAWAMPSSKVAVLYDPLIERVGFEHAGQGIPDGWDGQAVKDAWLQSVGITPRPEHHAWNYMNAEPRGG